jgi:hypothetical protein
MYPKFLIAYRGYFKTFLFLFFVLLIGLVAVLCKFGYENFIEASMRTYVPVERNELRNFAKDVLNFYEKHGMFPNALNWNFQNKPGDTLVQISTPDPKYVKELSLGCRLSQEDAKRLDIGRLVIPQDDVYKARRSYFGYILAYVADNETAIVYSCGPDHKYDIDLGKIKSISAYVDSDQLKKISYDPSNGTRSSGDIWCYIDPHGSSKIVESLK